MLGRCTNRAYGAGQLLKPVEEKLDRMKCLRERGREKEKERERRGRKCKKGFKER